MRTLLVILATAWTVPALAGEPAKDKAAPRWDCLARGADDKPFAVVEALDEEKATSACKVEWKRLDAKERRKRWRDNQPVEDDLFSRRSLEK